MSEDTAVLDKPETEEAAPAVNPDIEYDLQVGPVLLPWLESTVKKGRGKGNVLHYVRVDHSKPDPFSDIKQAVGVENFNRWISVHLRAACVDATHDAVKDGEVTDVDLAKMFAEQFVPDTRRSKTGVKQLKEKQQELLMDITPLITKQAHGEKLSPEDNNRLLQLMVDFGDLNEKIEAKSRKGKKEVVAKAA